MAEYQGPRYTQGPNVYGDLQNYRFAMGGTETKYTQGPRVGTNAAHTSRGSGPAPTVGGYRTPGSPQAQRFTPAASGLGSPDYSQQMNVAERGGQIGDKNKGGGGNQGGGRGGFNLSVGDVNIGGQQMKNIQAQGNVSMGDYSATDSFNYTGTLRQPAAKTPPNNPNAPAAGGATTPPNTPPSFGGRSHPTPYGFVNPTQFQTKQPANPAAIGTGPKPLGAGPTMGAPTAGTPAAPSAQGPTGPINPSMTPAQQKADTRRQQGPAGATQAEYDTIGRMSGQYGPWPSEATAQQPTAGTPTGPAAIGTGPKAVGPAQGPEPTNPSDAEARRKAAEDQYARTHSQAGVVGPRRNPDGSVDSTNLGFVPGYKGLHDLDQVNEMRSPAAGSPSNAPRPPAGAAPAQEPKNPSAKKPAAKPAAKKPAAKASKSSSSKPKMKQGSYTKPGAQGKRKAK